MAITITGRGNTSAAASATTLDLAGVTVTAGNTLVVTVGNDSNSIVSSVVFDPGGTPENLVEVDAIQQGVGKPACAIWVLHDMGGGSAKTVTVTWASAVVDRYVAALEVTEVGADDTSGSVTGKGTTPSVSTDATTSVADTAVIAVLTSDDGGALTITGDADTTYGAQQPGGVSHASGHEVHASAQTMTAGSSTGNDNYAFVIAAFKAGTPATQYVGAGVVSSAGTAPAAAVSPGSVNVPATVSSSSGTAPDAAVAPGSVNVPATVSSSSGAAPAAAVAPGLVNVPAEVAASTGTAPDATVTTITNVAAEVASSSGTAPDAAVAPGSVDVPAEVVSAAGAAPSALVAPGLVNVPAEVAAAAAAAVAAGVAPGSVDVVAEVAAATASAVGQGVTFSHPPVKYHAPYSDSGVHQLDSQITINSITKDPLFRYSLKAASAAGLGPMEGYGADLSVAGSGLVYDRLSPLLGSQDGAALLTSTGRIGTSTTAEHDITTEDIVAEFVCRPDADGVFFAKLGSGPVGYQFGYFSGVFRAYLDDGVTASKIVWSAAHPAGSYYHVMFFLDKSGSGRACVNGFYSADGFDISTVGSLTNAAGFALGSNNFATAGAGEGELAYAAVWVGAAWLDTHNQEAVAKERFWKACGIWPALAQGTAAPTSFTRADPAYIDRFDDSGNRVLVQVGPNWPRVCEREDSTGRFRGYLPEGEDTNLIFPSSDMASWLTVGSPTVTANDIASPDPPQLADKINCTDSGDRVYVSKGGGTGSGNAAMGVWVKRVSTSGTLRLYNPAGAGIGDWTVGLSALPDAWVLLTHSSSYVTVVASWKFSSGGLSGITVTSNDATDITFHVWGADVFDTGGLEAPSHVETAGAADTRAADVLKLKADDGNIGGTGSDKQLRMSCDVLLPDQDCKTSKGIFYISDGGSSAHQLLLYQYWNPDRITFYATIDPEGTQWNIAGTTDLSDGQRKHVEGRWKPNDARIFVDGSQEGATDTSCDPPDNLDTIHVGVSNTGASQFGGLIANLTAWQELEVTAEVASATGTANPCTVKVTQNVAAEVAASTATELDAAVSPGAVQVAAQVAAATASALAATVAPGLVNVAAAVVSAVATAVNATVSLGGGAQYVAAEVVSAAATALAAVVAPGSVSVPAEVASATGTAPDAAVAPGGVNVAAAVVSSAGASPDADVAPGSVSVPAEVAASTGTATAAAVAPGPVSVAAEVASSVGAAPNATVNLVQYVAAQVVSAAGAALNAIAIIRVMLGTVIALLAPETETTIGLAAPETETSIALGEPETETTIALEEPE